MSEERDMIVGVPSRKEAERKIDEGRPTALDLFINRHEPAAPGDKGLFRQQLLAVLAEAEGRFRVRALYARLRGCCPYCEGADVAGPMDSAAVERERPGGKIRVPVACENCGAKWYDVYDLFRVETVAIGER